VQRTKINKAMVRTPRPFWTEHERWVNEIEPDGTRSEREHAQFFSKKRKPDMRLLIVFLFTFHAGLGMEVVPVSVDSKVHWFESSYGHKQHAIG
jgi:hypothetical protein